MDFHLLQPIEQLIFKLTYCKRIGISGKWKIVSFAEQYQKTFFSVEEIIRIAGITQYQAVFKKSWTEISDSWLEQEARKQQFITWLSLEYPGDLQHFYQAPLILFYVGNLELLQHRKLAFVGARDASKYGLQVLYQLIPRIVQQNIVTVSGLAKGIDQYSHELTIHAGGHTIGVIGCGLDLCYPREVASIFLEMRRNHLILSEYPKGTKIQRHHFPMRNRIIAGLSQGACVIEAKERSGSLITAQLALEYGKEVFAIPGEILSGQSNGCHRLIQDGAKCVCSIQDILEELP
ncbi:DNA-protecting protein DprA [Enterococcus saccharolyticus]|uniref:DNA-processing protein DprA n=1 Tax=Enterococcus saccharolyticus TaxID=41997 RepID=UPI001E33110C|nr:DNA-processing protein DprA [Enterococcus saccharolyticus]MCD5003334.1 DNA-protecting protein DprA [Enterococcus saccharolyticus]